MSRQSQTESNHLAFYYKQERSLLVPYCKKPSEEVTLNTYKVLTLQQEKEEDYTLKSRKYLIKSLEEGSQVKYFILLD